MEETRIKADPKTLNPEGEMGERLIVKVERIRQKYPLISSIAQLSIHLDSFARRLSPRNRTRNL